MNSVLLFLANIFFFFFSLFLGHMMVIFSKNIADISGVRLDVCVFGSPYITADNISFHHVVLLLA